MMWTASAEALGPSLRHGDTGFLAASWPHADGDLQPGGLQRLKTVHGVVYGFLYIW